MISSSLESSLVIIRLLSRDKLFTEKSVGPEGFCHEWRN